MSNIPELVNDVIVTGGHGSDAFNLIEPAFIVPLKSCTSCCVMDSRRSTTAAKEVE